MKPEASATREQTAICPRGPARDALNTWLAMQAIGRLELEEYKLRGLCVRSWY